MELEYKKCSNPTCENPLFPATEEYFYKQKSYNKKLGEHYKLSSWCKMCISKNNMKWQNKNRDKKRESDNKYYKTKKGRETIKRTSEVRKKNTKKFQITKPEKIKEYNQDRSHKNHNISKEQWNNCKIFFDNSCAYCGISENEAKIIQGHNLHKEHVNHEGTNDLSNCVPACRSCNSHKWKFKLSDWYNIKNEHYNEERLNKIHTWIQTDYKKYI